jgi:hypothetical protein
VTLAKRQPAVVGSAAPFEVVTSMQLNRGQIPQISRKIVRALVAAQQIEVVSEAEVVRDVESVLDTYLRQQDDIVSRTRDLVQQRGLPQGEFSRIKQLVAEQQGLKIGDDALGYLLEQILAMLMHSSNVDEVYADDLELKRAMRPFLRAEEHNEQALDAEVRSKLKHVEEGSRVWEIEYRRMKEDIKRRRGM